TVQKSTFAQALAPAKVDYEYLRKRYNPFLQLALRFLGVMAHCYPYMEIWPTSFRSYNLMLPNLMEFPGSLFGSPSIGLRGLGMYASSRAANCMYCSAHCCAVGIRGGLDATKLKRAMSPGDVHSPGERALIRVANGMSTVPATLLPEDVRELQKHFKPAEVDGLVLPIVMMGFLNKMMDAMGFNLEEGVVKAVEDVATASGWSAGRHEVVTTGRERHPSKGRPWRLWLGMVPYMPAAVLADSRWTKGVPSSASRATPWLLERTGYRFPMITAAKQGRIIRTLSTMVRDNLDPEVSEVGTGTKQLAGVIYTAGLFNDELVRGTRRMAEKAVPNVSVDLLDRLVELASETLDLNDPNVLDDVERNLLALA
ncbi:MAG: carboxymuconolactone decarboxylase family protein, partial [Nannocystaceae bacterium]